MSSGSVYGYRSHGPHNTSASLQLVATREVFFLPRNLIWLFRFVLKLFIDF